MKAIKSIQEIQKIEYQILLYVDKIARRNKIRVMLGGGTLLGAARHKGFIPWDDDIDIMILRKDYEKLIRCIEEDQNESYKVFTVHNKKDYHLPFAKVIDTRTMAIPIKEIRVEGMGASIDLFPIDSIPNEPHIRKNILQFLWNKLDIIHTMHEINYSDNMTFAERKMRIALLRFHARTVNMALKCMPRSRTKYVAAVMGLYKEREIMNRSDMIYCTKLFFVDREFFVPKGYKKYLESLYGSDYMQMPPTYMQRPKHAVNLYWK